MDARIYSGYVPYPEQECDTRNGKCKAKTKFCRVWAKFRLFPD